MNDDWHRIFGVSVASIVRGLPVRVFTELELAQLKQRLDLAVLLIEGLEPRADEWPDLPDGLNDLVDYNLITYKSLRESLTRGAVLELVSHFVLFGKQQWGKRWEAAVDRCERYRLIAVATRRPRWLRPEKKQAQRRVMEGVLEVAVYSVKLALRDLGEWIMHRAWTLRNSRKMFAKDGSTPTDWSI